VVIEEGGHPVTVNKRAFYCMPVPNEMLSAVLMHKVIEHNEVEPIPFSDTKFDSAVWELKLVTFPQHSLEIDPIQPVPPR